MTRPPLPAGVDWIPVDEALARLRARSVAAALPVETLPLALAHGRVLAADVTARRAHPPAPNAAVDGWGFAAATAQPEMPVQAGRSAAGQPFGGAVPAGHALRILTGAILPEGVDTVAMQEDADLTGDRLRLRLPKAGANTRPKGEDVDTGASLLAAGRRLGPAELALIAATGTGSVPVYRKLRVGVLSTGDEIAEPGAPAAPHQVYDANRPMLLTALAQWGCEPVDLGIQPDDGAAIRRALDHGAADCDALISSGGASASEEDHIARLLSAEGDLTAWRIAMKPGRPLALARWRGVPVFGLPGNPVAALVCAAIFARPALAVMAGAPWPEPARYTVPAAFHRRPPAGRREWLRARLIDGAAEVFPSEGSGRVSGLAWADGLVDLGEAGREVHPGDPVSFLPWSGLGLG